MARTRSGSLLPFVPLIVAITAATTGCGEGDDLSFIIYQNQVPGAGCVVSTTSNLYRPDGVLDIGLERGYWMFPLLRNDMPATKDTFSRKTDPNALQLRRFEVELDLGASGQDIPTNLLRFTQLTSGILLPGDQRASRVQVITDELAKRIELPKGARPTVVATVRAVAESRRGEIRSIPFHYPIRLCDGCLVRRVKSCDDAVSTKNVCGLPQDTPLVCCNDDTLGFTCLADSGTND